MSIKDLRLFIFSLFFHEIGLLVIKNPGKSVRIFFCTMIGSQTSGENPPGRYVIASL